MRAFAPLPLAIKVPLLVAALMIAVAAGISKIVLERLSESQTQHLAQLTEAYLDGLSTALQPAMTRRDTWEAFDALDRARQRYSGVRALDVIAILPDGSVLAAADPIAHPVRSPAPERALASAPPAATLASDAGRAWIGRDIRSDGARVGRIAAEIDVSAYLAERREAATALVLVNAALTLALAGLGYLFVRRMLAPTALLARAFAATAAGRPAPIPPERLPRAGTEAGRLLRGYNDMVAALEERETLRRRLVEDERAAMLGKLASTLAHEVNNPLGGLFNAVAMIRRHGDDPARRDGAASLLERGLASIRNIVRATLVLWKDGANRTPLGPADLEDLRFLAQSESEARGIRLDWHAEIGDGTSASAQDVRQVALNLLLNAFAVSSPGATVAFAARDEGSRTTVEVRDEGPGLPEGARALLTGGDSRLPAKGLGLWTVARIVAANDGTVEVGAAEGGGTAIRVRFPHAEEVSLDARPAA